MDYLNEISPKYLDFTFGLGSYYNIIKLFIKGKYYKCQDSPIQCNNSYSEKYIFIIGILVNIYFMISKFMMNLFI